MNLGAGQAADHERERAHGGGTTPLAGQWERPQMAGEKSATVTITLTAGLHAED